MFDQQRQFTRCAFCTTEKVSKEHLFGEALHKSRRVSAKLLQMKPECKGGPLKPKNSNTDVSGVQLKILCSRCNSQFGGKFMTQATKAMESLVDGIPSIDDAAVPYLYKYFCRMGYLIDAYYSCFATDLRRLPDYNQKMRRSEIIHYPNFDDATRFDFRNNLDNPHYKENKISVQLSVYNGPQLPKRLQPHQLKKINPISEHSPLGGMIWRRTNKLPLNDKHEFCTMYRRLFILIRINSSDGEGVYPYLKILTPQSTRVNLSSIPSRLVFEFRDKTLDRNWPRLIP